MTYRQLVALFFISNGLGNVGLKVLGAFESEASVPNALLFLYLAAVLSAKLSMRGRSQPIENKNVLIGLIAGVTSALGLAGLALAVPLVPGYILFPVTSGGALILVALIGRLAFREKIGPYGIAGITAGALALVLLSL